MRVPRVRVFVGTRPVLPLRPSSLLWRCQPSGARRPRLMGPALRPGPGGRAADDLPCAVRSGGAGRRLPGWCMGSVCGQGSASPADSPTMT